MSGSVNKGEIIQYVPFMSFVHPSFWHTLTEMKIDVDKLSENTKQIFGRFTYRDDLGPVFEVDGTSFNRYSLSIKILTIIISPIIACKSIRLFVI